MKVSRAAIVGGGPGGLYAARLLKLTQPSCEVTVYEQDRPDETFGFGVGLAADTQRHLEAADSKTFQDIRAAGRRHDMTMAVQDRRVQVRNNRLIGIARTELLTVLQHHAATAGVRIEHGVRRTASELDADVVVAADGAGSHTRGAGDFGESIETGRGLYLWCGAELAIPDAVFTPVETGHGVFVAHAYPYSADRSTFLIETDEETWRRAGFDHSTDATPPGTSDRTSLRYLEAAFAEALRGAPLIGNRTRWTKFRTVRCERWSSGRVVLLGDAAHTVHFSLGSGTKLAMEDAIRLVATLSAEDDVNAAFSRYERERRAAVERLQELARRSRLWWESFPSRLGLSVDRLMVAYMTRAGNVPLGDFATTNPHVVTGAAEAYAGRTAPARGLVDWVLRQPFRHGETEFPHRVLDSMPDDMTTVADVVDDPWGTAGNSVVSRAADARRDGAAGFLFVGPDDRPSVLTRLDLAERVRTEVGGPTVVDGPRGLRADFAAALVSGRCDAVSFKGEGL